VIYDIPLNNDEFLTTPVPDFDFNEPPIDPAELATNLVATMYSRNGYGLAANQCGLPYRCFAMIGPQEDFVFFNPRIVYFAPEKDNLEEGCLSFPGLIIKVPRSTSVRIRFQGPNGETFSRTLTGMSARVAQHELCHLDGKMFFEGITKLRLSRSIKDAKKRKYDYSNRGMMKYAK
jgi:peptide deformylase